MLIGSHVSPAGGLANAIGRGEALGCEAIQIFNQSPRAWRPTNYTEDDFAEYRERAKDSPVKSVLIHAIYLINPAGSDRAMRKKSMASLTHALEVGAGIGSDGVVVHPGALKTDTRAKALERATAFVKEALAESEGCDLLLENNAGSQQLLGLHFEELAAMIDGAGGDKRLGVCLDSCHLFAAGFEIRTPEAVTAVVDQYEKQVGKKRLRAIHLNDSKEGLGELRDRHEDIGKGKIGSKGFRAFLSEPRFEGLPATLETPGPEGRGPNKRQVTMTKRLRREGIERR